MRLTTRTKRRACLRVESLEGRALLTAGALDTSFDGTGVVVTDLAYGASQGEAVQSDLKTVVVGLEVLSPLTSTLDSVALIRYNVDGSLDSTFGSGGEVVVGTNSNRQGNIGQQSASVAIQPDGKIVVATDTAIEKKGSLTSCDMLVLRFNTNGTLDTSFGQKGETDIHLSQGMTAARAVDILSSGQIVVAGMNISGSIGPEFIVARLTSSGALDTTFGPNGQGYNYTTISSTATVFDSVGSLGVDASGNLLVGGNIETSSGGTDVDVDQVVRYTPAGLIDTSFGNQGIYDQPAFGSERGFESIGFQSNGQIILGSPYNPSVGSEGVTRLNPNGTLDTTFGSNGYFSDPNGVSDVEIAVQPNNDILFETYLNTSEGGMLVDRLLPGGSLDPSFGTGGEVELAGSTWDEPVGLTVGPDGNITGTAIYDDNDIGGSVTFRLLGDAPITGQLAVSQQPPASLTAGTPFGLSAEVEDSSGNVETSYNGPVTVALANSPAGATLGGTLTVTASAGVATFSGLTLTEAASSYTLVVSGTSLGDAVTTAMTVSPSTASQVVITQQPPSSVTAGSGFGLQAAIEDAYGNVVTTAGNTLTVALASNPGATTLGGTLTATASNGVATFSGLTLTKAATGYTLQLSSTGLGGSTTSALTVNAAAAVGLLITQQPTSVVVNTGFTLVVEIVDAYGNVVTSANNSVTISLGSGPSGGKLSGTLTATAKNGVVTFSGLKLSKVGTGYTILFSSKGLTGATSGPIAVT
jgi:uncharacterized delta-60 repeat protein